MKLLFPLLLLSFATSAAWAEVPEVKLVTISDFKYEGNGCPKGSVSHHGSLLHDDKLDDGAGFIEVLYKKLGMRPAVYGGRGLENASCSLKLSLTFEPGYRFQMISVVRVDYKNFMFHKDMTIDTTYTLGNTKGVSLTAEYSGVGFEAPLSESDLSKNQEFYSDCSGQVDVTIQTNLNVVSESKRDDDEIDDISMAYVDNDAFEYFIRKCE